MARIEWTEIQPEIIDLKFTRTENDSYRTELNPNIFCLNYFSFQEKFIEPNNPNWKRLDLKLNPNQIMLIRKLHDSKLIWFELQPNDLITRSKTYIQKVGKVSQFEVHPCKN